MFLSNGAIINTDLINEKLKEMGTESAYFGALKTLTFYFAATFFVSAILNYFLAINIVTEISQEVAELERMQIRNQQIADLTWKSYLVILAPSMAMISVILWRANSLIKRCTTLSLEDVLKK